MYNFFSTLTLFAKSELPLEANTLSSIIGFLSLAGVGFIMLYGVKTYDKNFRELIAISTVMISMSMALFTSVLYNHFCTGTETCNHHDAIVDGCDDLPPLDSIANMDKRKDLDRKAKIMIESLEKFENSPRVDSRKNRTVPKLDSL